MKIGREARVCVIGAGPSGITAAKHLLQVGATNLVVYERNSEVGGTWLYSPEPTSSSVYESTHIVSSKTLSQYHDFPMPAHYPDYPHHRLLKAYFQSYAAHFGILPYIQFNTSVTHVAQQPDATWAVTLATGQVAHFDHLIVANGHHSEPRYPTYPGTFSGQFLHSHVYRTPLPFQDKRVLVIGGGNSACDIVSDIARHAAFTALSWRRGYYIVPKYLFGSPPDVVNARFVWLPRALRQWVSTLVWRLATGGNARYGLPEPEHRLFEVHTTANSALLYLIGHGDVQPRKDIARFDGARVTFVDGLTEEYDVVIAATGYKITFPFFDPAWLNFEEGDVPLYLRVFHPDHPSLYFIGLVQPMGALWPLSDTQAQLVANRIVGHYTPPADQHARIQQEVAAIRRHFKHSPRHTIEVEYHSYLNRLRRELPPQAPRWGDVPLPQAAPAGD